MSCRAGLQAGAAKFLFLKLDDDAEETIAAGGTHQADLHGTAGQALQFERQIAEKGGEVGSERLVGERRQPASGSERCKRRVAAR